MVLATGTLTTEGSATMPLSLELPASRGGTLRASFWSGTTPKGVLIISHGLGEHSACYDVLAETLSNTAGLVDVATFDYRGHGLSSGKRGYVQSYADFLDDLRAVTSWVSAHREGVPIYLLGHSNGGQVALHGVLAGLGIQGLILSNPSLKVIARVPRYKYLAGLVLRRFAPGVTLGSTVLDEDLTRHPEHLALRKSDPLRHGRINAPLYFGMIEGGASILQRADAIHLPLLLVLGGSDPVIDSSTTRAYFDRIASLDKTLRLYPEMLHEPLNEIGGDAVVAEIVAWLQRQLDGAAAATSPDALATA